MNLIHPTNRVVDWLKGVDSGQGSSTVSAAELTEQSEWNLVNRMDTSFRHSEPPRSSAMWFSVGESGNISILFVRSNPNESTLSMLYSSHPTSPVILSSGTERLFHNPVFVNLSGREYLAVSCLTDASIHLWDVVNRTSRVVYQKGSGEDKDMMLCVKDNETVIYGERRNTDGVHNVYLLNTSTEQWSLRGTLRLQTGLNIIFDMSHVQMADGTPCLVLCDVSGHSVTAVEMSSGNIRWRLGVEQMGEGFTPSSVCIDDDHNVYVCDHAQQKVYMLSSEDGLVIRTVLNSRQHGTFGPIYIQIQDDHLYVSHVNISEERKWVISKFGRK